MITSTLIIRWLFLVVNSCLHFITATGLKNDMVFLYSQF